MENKLEVFKNEEFGSVRVIQDGDKYLFCGSDVAKALGYNEPHKAVARHCKGGMKHPIPTNGGNQDMIVIPEGDVYRLIMHSKLPSAERFEKWVFDEVLPTIRKHGAYMNDSVLAQVMDNPDLIFLMAEAMLHERSEKGRLSVELAAAKPKAAYFDAFIHPEDCTNIRATAKELQVPERWFARFLVKAGFMYRCPAGTLMPYNSPKNEGLFRVKDFIRNGHKGAYTLITPEGKDLLRQLIPDAQAAEV
ncbi:MAG: phage antirepressor [Oscillospiraceae bacterium]|nr:phage antirepressor [Oscillospiraceae bacterium]